MCSHRRRNSNRWGRPRLLLNKVGEIYLGDRWRGGLRVEGSTLFVGKDTGWFTTSGGTGGDWLSQDPADRVLVIDVNSGNEL